MHTKRTGPRDTASQVSRASAVIVLATLTYRLWRQHWRRKGRPRRRARRNIRRKHDYERRTGGRVLKTDIAAMGADQFSGYDEAKAISVALG